jgi:hypothetical protein
VHDQFTPYWRDLSTSWYIGQQPMGSGSFDRFAAMPCLLAAVFRGRAQSGCGGPSSGNRPENLTPMAGLQNMVKAMK